MTRHEQEQAIARDLELCDLGTMLTTGRLRQRYIRQRKACMAQIAKWNREDAIDSMNNLATALRNHATDWNGEQMPDLEPAKGDPTAGLMRAAAAQIEKGDAMRHALTLALEYWAHRQQRYKNRHPAWVQSAKDAIA